MSNYIHHRFHDSPSFVNVFDEQPLWSAHFGQFMLKHIPLKANITVLELGSGTGFPLLELAERLGGSCRLYGLDPWQNANARAREKIRQYGIENTEILDGTGAEIPFGDNSIDLITSNLGINNFEDREKVFAECARVLKPGGILALTTNLQGHWQEFYEVYDDVLRDNGRTEELQELKAHIARRGSVDSISALFTGAGLRVSRTFTENFSMHFLDGSAFLRHHFIGVGWMEEWVRMLPEESRTNIFLQVEERLNQKARQAGELQLNVPMAYIEGVK